MSSTHKSPLPALSPSRYGFLYQTGCLDICVNLYRLQRVSFGSNHLCKTRFGHRIAAIGIHFNRRLHVVATILGPGRVIEVRLIDLLPGNLFARVAGNLSHHGDHRAASHVVAVVDGITGANRCEEYVVLSLVRVASSLPAPVCFAPDPVSQNRRLAFAAKHYAGSTVVASGCGTAEGVDGHAALKFINNRMVIEHIAIDRFYH